MQILTNNQDHDLKLNINQQFAPNLGWEDSFKEYQNTILYDIINPIESFESTKYLHQPYVSGPVNSDNIWYFFYFKDSNDTYNNGLDYSLFGISPQDNSRLVKGTTGSFFRLEFYSTPNLGDQKLLFTKNINITSGQKVFDLNINDFIYVPVFKSNSIYNNEVSNIYWFNNEDVYSGLTFYMTARFFNSYDGSITQLLNKNLTTQNTISNNVRVGTYNSPINFYENDSSYNVTVENDFFYKVILNRTNMTYTITTYFGNN